MIERCECCDGFGWLGGPGRELRDCSACAGAGVLEVWRQCWCLVDEFTCPKHAEVLEALSDE